MNIQRWRSRDTWVRSREGWITGVCAGLSDKFGINPNLLRILWVVAVFCFGIGLLVYLALAVSLPREDQIELSHKEKLLGVCWQLSQRSQLDVGLVRFLAIMLAVASFGSTVVGYLILYFVLPQSQKGSFTSDIKD